MARRWNIISNPIIIQWGTGQGTVTFPTAFTSTDYQAVAVMGTPAACVPYTKSYTLTSMEVKGFWAGNSTAYYTNYLIRYIVIGY